MCVEGGLFFQGASVSGGLVCLRQKLFKCTGSAKADSEMETCKKQLLAVLWVLLHV